MRPRPCSPGGYERRSIAHFSVRQRSPLRNSFMPSRRHCLHFGDLSLATLDPPPLPWPHAVVRLRRHILHAQDLEARGLERTDCGLAARAGALHEDLDLLEAVLHPLTGTRGGRHLCGERRRLAGALEAGRAGGLPRDHVPVLVGERDDRVVERRLDVSLSDRDVLLDAAARAASGRLATRRCHASPSPSSRVRRSSPAPCVSERSCRRSPSTSRLSSMYVRSFVTSSSVRSRIFVFGSSPSSAATLRAVGC